MAPILRAVVAQVSRGGRSVLSRRNLSSERCLSCGMRKAEGVTASSELGAGAIAHTVGAAMVCVTYIGGYKALRKFVLDPREEERMVVEK